MGAYERDNFGDLLFLTVTESYVPDFEIIAGAPFAASEMKSLLDHEVKAYGDYLAEHDVDAIWCVGGQTGATRMSSAYRMSMTAEEFDALQQVPIERRRAVLAQSYNGRPLDLAYIPAPGAFPRNAAAAMVLNSVGLAGLTGLVPGAKESLISTLRGVDAITVRDRQSSQVLDELDISHRLSPDVVHALGALRPADYDPTSEVAVVQISTRLLQRYGEDAVVHALATSPSLDGLRLQFLAAGVANRHDSLDDLQRLADRVSSASPKRKTEVLTNRRPLDIVDALRAARVVIGTSLHIRIVSAAYGVPRVTLERAKPALYAEHWDSLMPYNVPVVDLDDAVAAALAAGGRAEVREASDRLVRLADENARDLADQVREIVAADPQQRQEVGAQRRKDYLAVERRRGAEDSHARALERQLGRTRRELAKARKRVARLEDARGSRSSTTGWRRKAAGVRRRLAAVRTRVGRSDQ